MQLIARMLPARRRAHRGFTLIELAVVLTVITIILVAVLKSTSVVDSAKGNDVIAMAGDLSESARRYREKYQYLPGDDPGAVANLTPPVLGAGDGNGLIDFNAANVMEPNLVPNHLFQAGMIRVTPDPVNGVILKSHYGQVWLMSLGLAAAAGGPGGNPCGTAVTYNNVNPNPPARNVIVFANLPSSIAAQIDQKYDDGVFNSGAIRASAAYNAAANAPPIACFAMPL